MENSVLLYGALALAILLAFSLFFLKLTFLWWVLPFKTYHKLKRCGFGGPTPSFPLGNIEEIKKNNNNNNRVNDSSSLLIIATSNSSAAAAAATAATTHMHDIHGTVFPYFSRWQNSHGKVFIYWLGTEPFLYIADPEFLKKMSTEVLAKKWGKPNVFRNDRKPMFGNGLIMVEGNEWVHHRHVVAPSFSPLNLKAMGSMIKECTEQMMERWLTQINSGNPEIDIEKEIIATAGEIIATTSFGMKDEKAREICDKLRELQMILFKTTRYVGVPFGKWFNTKKTLEARKLGKEIDKLLLNVITNRKNNNSNNKENKGSQEDLLGLLLEANRKVDGKFGKTLSTRELVDECKTFFFAGHETTALAISWTLFLLAVHEDWQIQLRDEIRELAGHNKEIDINVLSGLKKMKWVMNEAVRLYPPAPNVQRQAKEDIKVDNNFTVPSGTNIWIDVVGMHHDPTLWGDDVNEFRPERFIDDVNGGCNHKMGYLPFGFGGRMCVGRNLSFMEYKIVLTLLLSRFRFKLSPSYQHSPAIMLSLRPTHGLPLIVETL